MFADLISSITWKTSLLSSPNPTIMPDLVKILGSMSLTLDNKFKEWKYLAPGLTDVYSLGTVSRLWLG